MADLGGIGPELAGLGAPAAGIKHRQGRFVGKQLRPLPELDQAAAQLSALLEGLDWRRVHEARETTTPTLPE